MKKEDLYNGISGVCPKYLEEADSYRPRKLIYWKRWGTIAVCICLCFCSVVPVLAASDVNFAYELLYVVAPSFAQDLKPVRVSCEDNGIKMEVIAANISGANAEILISMQDIKEDRLDETTDLLDSYSIHTPYNQIGGCSLVEYDDETKTAFFMLNIEQANQVLISGDKITFSVSKLLSRKEQSVIELAEIDLEKVPSVNNLIENPSIRGWGGTGLENFDRNNPQLMQPDKERDIVLEEGVVLTAWGIIDDKLHVQILYDNILETDNHGKIYLKNESGEILRCEYNVAFWDDNKADSYEEYIFSVSADELIDYEIWGEFWTANGGSMKGEWQVTFPLTE